MTQAQLLSADAWPATRQLASARPCLRCRSALALEGFRNFRETFNLSGWARSLWSAATARSQCSTCQIGDACHPPACRVQTSAPASGPTWAACWRHSKTSTGLAFDGSSTSCTQDGEPPLQHSSEAGLQLRLMAKQQGKSRVPTKSSPAVQSCFKTGDWRHCKGNLPS